MTIFDDSPVLSASSECHFSSQSTDGSIDQVLFCARSSTRLEIFVAEEGCHCPKVRLKHFPKLPTIAEAKTKKNMEKAIFSIFIFPFSSRNGSLSSAEVLYNAVYRY